MDPLVLIDAIADCMAYEEKELCKLGNIAISLIIEVTSKQNLKITEVLLLKEENFLIDWMYIVWRCHQIFAILDDLVQLPWTLQITSFAAVFKTNLTIWKLAVYPASSYGGMTH